MSHRSSCPGRAWFALSVLSILALSGGCAWLAPLKALAADEEKPSYETLYMEASLALATRDYEGAIRKLSPLRQNKDCPAEVLQLLGEALLRGGNEDEGRKVIDETVGRFPEYVPAYRLRSTVNRLRGKYAEAIADIEAALKFEPKNFEMLEELGLLRYRTLQRRIEEKGRDAALHELADAYIRLAATRDGSQKIPALLILSGIYSEMKQHDKAVQTATQAVEYRPQNVRAQTALAETYAKAQQPKEALHAYRQALLIEPENAAIRAKVAEMVSASGNAGGLLGFYEELAQSFPKLKEIQKTYGEELIKAKEWRKAAEHYRKFLALWPDERDARSTFIVSLYMLGQESEATKQTEALAGQEGFTAKDLSGLAQMLARAGKVEAATQLYQKVASLDPENPQILLGLAGAQIEAGKRPDAIQTLQKLVEKRPELFLAVAMLGQLYAEAGKFDEAHALYDRAEKSVTPDNKTELLVRKADLFRREGKAQQARELLEQLTAKNESVPEVAVRMLVELYAADGSFDAAHELLDKFISRATGDQVSGWQNVKAWLYWRSKRYKDAIAILEGLHATEPANFQVIEFLADNYAQAGDFEKAQGLLRASEAALPDDLKDDLLLLRARLYRKEKKKDQAVAVIEQLLKLKQDDERFLQEAGQYYYEAGRMEDAERVLRRAIELSPGDPEVYNTLGYFFAESGVRLDEALKLILKALELNPQAGHILDSLGWVYYQQANYAKSIEALESAIEKMRTTPDAVVFEHLGDAYMKRGSQDQARHYWSEALKIDPDSESVRKKLGKSEPR